MIKTCHFVLTVPSHNLVRSCNLDRGHPHPHDYDYHQGPIIAAWGNNRPPNVGRAAEVMAILTRWDKAMCLGVNADGCRAP